MPGSLHTGQSVHYSTLLLIGSLVCRWLALFVRVLRYLWASVAHVLKWPSCMMCMVHDKTTTVDLITANINNTEWKHHVCRFILGEDILANTIDVINNGLNYYLDTQHSSTIYLWNQHTWMFVPVRVKQRMNQYHLYGPRARYAKLRVAHASGMPGTLSPPPRVSDPDMHHGTCVTHVPWCMSGSLTRSFIWSRWQGKHSRHSRRMCNSQFNVAGKRPTRMKCSYMSVYICYAWGNFTF